MLPEKVQFRKLILIFLVVSLILLVRNRFIVFNPICDVKNRQLMFKSFFNFICNENPQEIFRLESHICDQLYPNQFGKSLFSRLQMDFQRFHKQKISYSDIENLSTSCLSCHRIQIINNKLYHIPSKTAFEYESRSRSIKMFLKSITELFPNIRDMDLFFNIQDFIDLTEKFNDILFNVPIFGLAKTTKIKKGLRHENILLMPCFTLWSWPEVRAGRWSTKFESIRNFSSKISYEKRIEKLFWRGILSWKRTWFAELSKKYPDMIDVVGMGWNKYTNSSSLTGSETYKTLEDHCQYKYLLHQEGNSYSSRIKYLLSCGSIVIFNHVEYWEEYWYHLLEDRKHLIFIQTNNNETIVNKTLDFFRTYPKQAKEIANQGQLFVMKYLNEHAISCYWWKLLNEYGKLIEYKPIIHPMAVLFDDFILMN